jgi:hypothetical protein
MAGHQVNIPGADGEVDSVIAGCGLICDPTSDNGGDPGT